MTDFTATLPRKRMGAGLLITDPSGRVLLVDLQGLLGYVKWSKAGRLLTTPT